MKPVRLSLATRSQLLSTFGRLPQSFEIGQRPGTETNRL